MPYDAAGNRLTEFCNIPRVYYTDTGGNNHYYSQDASHILSYGYDARELLISEASTITGTSGSSTFNTTFNHAFQNDLSNNFTSFAYWNGSTDAAYTGLGFTSDNQLSNGDFGAGFAYDGNGNTTNYKSSSANFVFDIENRLIGIPSLNFSAAYGPDDLRVKKTSVSGTLYFICDEDGLPLLSETDSLYFVISTKVET